jgi:hypothetical protein
MMNKSKLDYAAMLWGFYLYYKSIGKVICIL